MVNGPDYKIVQAFDNLWHEASINDVENGQTSGINKKEFDGMSLFLNETINNPNATAETKTWAQKKLDDLEVMKVSAYNQKNLKNDIEAYSPKGLWENIKDIFTKTEKDYYEENVISYRTMLKYNGGGIEAVKEGESHNLFSMGGLFGFGPLFVKKEE